MPNNKIYLKNLDKGVTKGLLTEHFSKYGEITEVNLPHDKKSRSPKGYAFISFAIEASVENALTEDGKPFLDREITVQIATEKRQKKTGL